MGLWWLSLLGVHDKLTERDVRPIVIGLPGASGAPKKK